MTEVKRSLKRVTVVLFFLCAMATARYYWIGLAPLLLLLSVYLPLASVRVPRFEIRLAISSLIATVAIVEIGFQLRELLVPRSVVPYYSFSGDCFEPSPFLSYWAKPNSSCMGTKAIGAKRIYTDKEYIFGSNGERLCTIHQPDRLTENRPRVDFFGCSFAFGEGLDGEDTMPCRFQNRVGDRYEVRNFAKQGFGSGEMLTILRQLDWQRSSPNRGDIGVYAFIEDHIIRTVGTYQSVLKSRPDHVSTFYQFGDSSKSDVIGYRADEQRGLKSLQFATYAVRVFGLGRFLTGRLDFPLVRHDEEVPIVAKVIEKAREIYEERTGGTFYLLVWPRETGDPTRELLRLLEQAGVSILRVPPYPASPDRPMTLHPQDSHPSKFENDWIADHLARALEHTRN